MLPLVALLVIIITMQALPKALKLLPLTTSIVIIISLKNSSYNLTYTLPFKEVNLIIIIKSY
jgi:hypothetical protein